jgi:tetratricopeptide (TPR) repeat protein
MITKRFAGLLVKRPSVTVGLWGSPGIGKTFAVHQLLRETLCKNLSLHATTNPSSLALALPRPKKLPAWVERMLEKTASGEFVETSTITDACGAILMGLAPIVLHLEDVHEVGLEQLEFIQNLARVVQRLKGVGLIVTSRQEPPEPFEILQLQPLSNQDIKQMLEREAGATLPSECVAWIQTRVVGNPLYALEFFRFLARQGFVWNDGQQWRWRVPDREFMPVTVEALIERAIREVCPDEYTRTALKARAYLENLEPNLKLKPDVWANVAGLESSAFAQAERNLQVRGVLNESGFVHPLFREVPVKGMNAQTRQSFARRALEVLPLEIAVVFIKDAELGDERSLELLKRVAEQSKTPQRWLAMAVEFSNGDERARLALEAARQLTQSDLRLAEKLYRVVLEVDTDTVNTDATVMLEFIALLTTLRPHEAQALFERLPASVRSSAQGVAVHFGLQNSFGNVAGIVQSWQDDLNSSSDLDPDVLVHVIYALKSVTRFDDAIQLADRVLAHSDLSPWQRARVLNRLSSVYGESTRYAQALELTEQVIEVLDQHQLGRRDVILHDRALYQKQLGDYRAAKRDLEQALTLALEVGRTYNEMMIRSFLGSVYCELGEYAQAEEFLLEAFEYQTHQPVSVYSCDTLNSLIELYIAWFERPLSSLLAQKYARVSLEHADALKMPVYLAASRSHAGFVELEYGSPERALQLALEALALKVSGDKFYGRWFPTWLEAKARIKLGEHAPALGLLEQTVAAFLEMGRAVEANLAGLDLDRLRDDLESAQDRLAWFRERGLINAVRQGLRLFPEFVLETPSSIPEAQAALQIQVLGTIHVAFEGKPEPVRGRKRQELLALLLEARIAGRSEVSKLELLDALYPDSDEDQATNALQETVRTTRSSLGADVIQTTQNGYALGTVTSDVEEFLKSGSTKLWRGAYLDGLTLESRDEAVRESLHLALFSSATNTLETEPREAARVGRILLEFDEYNLDYLELCVKALRATSNHKSLTRLYADARDRLLEVGEIIPERWQDFLERTSLQA